MSPWFETGISNGVAATGLALVAWLVTRYCRRPRVAFVLWLLVLLKLVAPPLVELPVASLRSLAMFEKSSRRGRCLPIGRRWSSPSLLPCRPILPAVRSAQPRNCPTSTSRRRMSLRRTIYRSAFRRAKSWQLRPPQPGFPSKTLHRSKRPSRNRWRSRRSTACLRPTSFAA